MRIDILTLFPGACEPFFATSILGRAQESERVRIRCHDIREFSSDPNRKVDDKPFGGGPGMVMMCQPIFDAVERIGADGEGKPTLVLLSPAGQRLNQRIVEELAGHERLLIVAGHYEGFDERIRLGLAPREISIGDYVLSGGESAAMVLVDAVVRLIPGVLGHPDSTVEESFSVVEQTEQAQSATDPESTLEYPHYTRPRVFRGMEVPQVLLSGDHGKIRQWRRAEARRLTMERRPDLLIRPMNIERDEVRRDP
jgi:tRNA (guanine37-N1)-methyltransferase